MKTVFRLVGLVESLGVLGLLFKVKYKFKTFKSSGLFIVKIDITIFANLSLLGEVIFNPSLHFTYHNINNVYELLICCRIHIKMTA